MVALTSDLPLRADDAIMTLTRYDACITNFFLLLLFAHDQRSYNI